MYCYLIQGDGGWTTWIQYARGYCACHCELKFSSSYDFSLEKWLLPSTSRLRDWSHFGLFIWFLSYALSSSHLSAVTCHITSMVLMAPVIPLTSHGHLRHTPVSPTSNIFYYNQATHVMLKLFTYRWFGTSLQPPPITSEVYHCGCCSQNFP